MIIFFSNRSCFLYIKFPIFSFHSYYMTNGIFLNFVGILGSCPIVKIILRIYVCPGLSSQPPNGACFLCQKVVFSIILPLSEDSLDYCSSLWCGLGISSVIGLLTEALCETECLNHNMAFFHIIFSFNAMSSKVCRYDISFFMWTYEEVPKG